MKHVFQQNNFFHFKFSSVNREIYFLYQEICETHEKPTAEFTLIITRNMFIVWWNTLRKPEEQSLRNAALRHAQTHATCSNTCDMLKHMRHV